jgi:hypothetical protein
LGEQEQQQTRSCSREWNRHGSDFLCNSDSLHERVLLCFGLYHRASVPRQNTSYGLSIACDVVFYPVFPIQKESCSAHGLSALYDTLAIRF